MRHSVSQPISRRQIRLIRGLNERLSKLRRSRSSDEQVLEANRQDATERFQQLRSSLETRHVESWRTAITNWDSQLDKQIGQAERITLDCLNYERLESRRLKKQFNENKASAKLQHENAKTALHRKFEETQQSLQKNRDSIHEKLQTQRVALDQQMQECREWVGMRTGSMALQTLVHPESSEGANEFASLRELPQVAREFEHLKSELLRGIERMRGHNASKLMSPLLFASMGLVSGLVLAVVAWLVEQTPIVIAIAGVGGATLTALGLYVVSVPLLTRSIGRLFPAVLAQERRANNVLSQGGKIAEFSYQAELAKATQNRASELQRLETEYRESRTRLVERYNQESARLVADCKSKRESTAQSRIANMTEIDRSHKPRSEDLKNQLAEEKRKFLDDHQQHFAQLENDFVRAQSYIVDRWFKGWERASRHMRMARQKGLEDLPSWELECFDRGDWPRSDRSLAWRLGEIRPDDTFVKATQELQLSPTIAAEAWPVFYELLSHGSLILDTDVASKGLADQIVRNTLLRAITSLMPGKLNVTIIDPEGLGKQYSWLMALADIDPTLVNHRVWTQPLHIAEQLTLTARHVEDVIQQSLRDKYSNLVAYNQAAGPMAVPFRLLMWSNFPVGLDDHAWQSLCAILSSGGKCGVGVILQLSDAYSWPTFAERSKLDEYGLKLKLRSSAIEGVKVVLDQSELSSYRLEPELPPTDDQIQRIMEHHVESLEDLGRRVIPFESLSMDSTEQKEVSSAEFLSVPIGMTDAGRIQHLKLGVGTAQHVVIAGKTGSGKSSLLHTMITSAAIKYSPNQLRFVLLDFKKGVEFQVYSESMLSHADIIGIESKREFGVSALEYVDRVMNARGDAFRQWGVQDLASLAKKYPDQALPRILILIDEFQELFVEDDKLSQHASMLMDRIVRQGRSFGIHLVLASQTLGGAYSLPRTTLSQMAVRIALQCDSSDAMLILNEDNTAAERLRYSGQAIYNDAGGRFESNQNFQVAYLEKSDQHHRLDDLTKFEVPRKPTVNPLGRQVVFEGHKPAIWDAKTMQDAVAELNLERGCVPMLLGESVSIDPPVIKVLMPNTGRNVMVVGQDDATAASILAGTLAGLKMIETKNAGNLHPLVLLLDGTRNEDVMMKRLVSALGTSSIQHRIGDIRCLDEVAVYLQEEFARRSADPDQPHAPMLFAIANVSRFRELRRSEEYTFGEDAGGSIKPDAVLANVLRDGPSLGIYVWIWADSANSLTRWLSRQSLRDIELRILMQMSASDSNQLIDTNAANRLDKYVALLHDDVDGKAVKFRPYAFQQLEEFLTDSNPSHPMQSSGL
jgi:DNA segregation ATPase FtsK/SpoIIIE, S-DNA-T family